MRRGNAQRYGAQQMTGVQARAQMKHFLVTCPDQILADVTVDNLVARYRIDERTAEYELIIERQRRAGRV